MKKPVDDDDVKLEWGSTPEPIRRPAQEWVNDISEDNKYPTESAREIVEELIPEWIAYFLPKNEDYGDNHHILGSKAQFVDVWRKAHKLKRALWDGRDMNHEDTDEILKDMIGHCFLALQLQRKGL